MSRTPPLSALRAFEAAARHGSLSAAARELNVTHAAIAQQVRRLEGMIGSPLLARSGRGVAATTQGAALAASLTEGFGTVVAAVERAFDDLDARPLRITATPSFVTFWLLPRLADFRARQPDLAIALDPSATVCDLVRDGFDVAFRFGRGDWPGLEATRIMANDMAVVAAPALLAERGAPRRPTDLAGFPLVRDVTADELSLWLAVHGVDVSDRRDVLDLPAQFAVEAVASGQGIGMVARAWIGDHLADGRLVALFEEEGDPALGYYLAHRPGPHRPPVKAFLAWAKRRIAEDAAG